MDVTIAREVERLERRLLVLATVGSAGPFIGLFGTVWGIMTSFQSIAASKNTSLAVVAPGIAEALFATAIGLVAAIPATIFYNKFVVRGEQAGAAPGGLRRRVLRDPVAADRRAGREGDMGSKRHGQSGGSGGKRRAPPARRHERDQRHAVRRRDAGAADHLHGVGAAADGRRADRPAADPGQEPRPGPEPLTISVNSKGQVFLQNTEIKVDELVPKLKAITEARGGLDERIYVRGDRKVEYGTVMRVMGGCRRRASGASRW